MKNFRWNKIYLIASVIIILGGCTAEVTKAKENFKFESGQDLNIYITTDIHHLADNLKDDGDAFIAYVNSGDGKQLGYINEIFDGLIYEIEKNNPDILIISGDLTNNGEKESHIDLAKKLEKIELTGTSVYVIPGNHDILNPWARSFKKDKQYLADSINEKEFSDIYAKFGYEEAVSRDKNTLSYLVTPSEDIWLLMLDTNKYEKNFQLGYPQSDGEIGLETIMWIQECSDLAKENGATIIPVMHHNVLNHSEVIQKGFTLNNYEEIVNLFMGYKYNLVFSGHIHIQDISSYSTNGNTLFDIVNNSLAVYPHQFGILKYTAQNNRYEYSTSKLDIESWSKDIGLVDENLNNFDIYSGKYFGKFAFDMAYKNLVEGTSLSEEEIISMSETMEILNLRYFAGIENKNSVDVMDSQGYKLWSNTSVDFLSRYISSISSDKDTDDNYLEIEIIKQPK